MNARQIQGTTYRPDEWEPAGRARQIQFLATDHEIQSWLVEVLNEEFRPYELVGVDTVLIENAYEESPLHYAIDEFEEFFSGPGHSRIAVWVRSLVVTPILNVQSSDWISYCLSLSGLIRILYGHPPINIRMLELTNRIRNRSTGEVYHHNEYLTVYNRLKRVIKNSARNVATLRLFGGGYAPVPEITVSDGVAARHPEGRSDWYTPRKTTERSRRPGGS